MEKSETWAKDIRFKIIEAAHNAGKTGLHLGSALSVADILAVLYSDILKYDPENPLSENRDYFILSKGHAYMAFYATLLKGRRFSARSSGKKIRKRH